MKQDEFLEAINRLARHNVGPKEATVLFALFSHTGMPVQLISKLTNLAPATIRPRLSMLVKKRLVKKVVSKREPNVYQLTPSGQLIIDQTLGAYEL